MNILFMTIGGFENVNVQGIYSDLLREFIKNGHKIYVACANQNANTNTYIDYQNDIEILKS